MKKTITIEYEITDEEIRFDKVEYNSTNTAEFVGILDLAKNAILVQKILVNKH